MPREKEGYRDVLQDIVETTGKNYLTKKDVIEYTGLNPRTVTKRFGVGRGGIAAALLARKMCAEVT